ncbi:MAG: matrixin family metalloprotease [Dehalococcoidia bacterium]
MLVPAQSRLVAWTHAVARRIPNIPRVDAPRRRLGTGLAAGSAVLAALVLVAVASMNGRTAEAHTGDLGFKWFSSAAADQRVATYASSAWTTAVTNAVSNWDSATVLSTYNYQSTTAQIKYYSGNYGNTGWAGAANIYSGSTTCGTPQTEPPGGCNKTTVKANSAILNLNDYYWNPWVGLYSASYQRQRTAAHELGHVFGLSHAECSSGALMAPTGCWYPSTMPPSNGVIPHDATHASSNAP